MIQYRFAPTVQSESRSIDPDRDRALMRIALLIARHEAFNHLGIFLGADNSIGVSSSGSIRSRLPLPLTHFIADASITRSTTWSTALRRQRA
jgi:hypothetical protein